MIAPCAPTFNTDGSQGLSVMAENNQSVGPQTPEESTKVERWSNYDVSVEVLRDGNGQFVSWRPVEPQTFGQAWEGEPLDTPHIRGSVEVESDQLIANAAGPKGNEGTVKALVQALEESDETIYGIEVGKTAGKRGVTIETAAPLDNGKPVPKPLHDQLVAWDFEHVGDISWRSDESNRHRYVE